MMDYRIKIIHTEDKKITREGVINLLRIEGIDVIGEAVNGLDLLNLLKKITPDLVLLDLEMPVMDGNQTLREIKAKYPNLKVIILTSYSDECLMEDFKAKGASAFLSKDCDSKTLANTIKRVFYSDGYDNFPKKINSIFTPREIKIIPYLLAGRTSKEIANLLGISTRTVEAARDRAYEKTKARNASEFSAHCALLGLTYLGFRKDFNQ